MTERNRLPAALEFKLTPNYVFRFQCSNNSSFKYSEFVFMSDSSNDYKWRLYPVVFVKSEQCPILWNLALIHFSKDAMSMLIVSQITIDIQQCSADVVSDVFGQILLVSWCQIPAGADRGGKIAKMIKQSCFCTFYGEERVLTSGL